MADEETYEFDPWDTSSGLPDRITVRLDNPHFGTDANIGNGQTLLFIAEGTIIAGAEDGTSNEFSQWFTCGDGWEAMGKGGARAVREDGKPRMFNENTNYAKFFKSLFNTAKEQGLDDTLRKRGTPFDAETWAGLVVYLERENYSFKDRDDPSKTIERSRLIVKRIEKMGDADTTSAAPKEEVQEAASVSTAPAEPAPAASPSSNGELDPKLKAKLRALARESTEHKVFVEKAFDVEGVLDNATAEEAIMAEGEGSIWASVKSEASA